jgi:hypothetical protein
VLMDFKRALARVQTDYGFYVGCQTNPAVTLAGYDLTAEERSALLDPGKLADMLMRGVEALKLRAALTITISGTHDWVNSAAAKTPDLSRLDRDSGIATEVEAIKQASEDDERTKAAVRLMELLS